jgi:Zn-dependent protease/CBS domain-containing protein
MFGKRIKIFKLFGFEVKIDLSWIILAFLITWTLAKGLFPYYYKGFSSIIYWWMGIFGALGLFFSIIFHEMSHSLVARRFGLEMKGITLFIFGGVAEMADEPPSAKAELAMALAGPFSSIILGLILFGINFLAKGSAWPSSVYAVINYLAVINLVLAAFNLLPAFPLDGGRVLRSILWGWKNNLKWATQIASKIGSFFGIVLIILGIYSLFRGNIIGGIWWFLIGMFLRGASQASYQQLLIRRAFEGEPISRFMNTTPVTVSPSISIEELIEKYIYKHHFKMFPVVKDGKLIGCVTIKQIKEVPREERDKHTVEELVKSCSPENTIGKDEDAMKALSRMKNSNSSRIMVVEGSKLVGVIALKDMLQFLSLKIDLEEE